MEIGRGVHIGTATNSLVASCISLCSNVEPLRNSDGERAVSKNTGISPTYCLLTESIQTDSFGPVRQTKTAQKENQTSNSRKVKYLFISQKINI